MSETFINTLKSVEYGKNVMLNLFQHLMRTIKLETLEFLYNF